METLAERLDLRGLDPEPWGARLVRARERAGLTTRQVTEALGPWLTKGGIYALEHRDGPPQKKMDRSRALLLLVFCGTDPGEFDLGPDDAPPGVDLSLVRSLATQLEGGSAQAIPGSLWTCAPHLQLVESRRIVVPLRVRRALPDPRSAA